MVTIGVVVAAIDGHHIGSAGAGCANGIGGSRTGGTSNTSGVPLKADEFVGAERHGDTLTQIITATNGGHGDGVAGVGVEADNRITEVGSGCRSGSGESVLGVTVAYLKITGDNAQCGRVLPCNVRCTCCGSDIEVLQTGTSGSGLKGDIIHISIPRTGGAHGTDGHKAALASIGAQGHLKLIKDGIGAHIHSGNLHKGVVVVGVAHHTHLKHGTVAGAGRPSPETHLEVANRIGIGVDARHHYDLVVAVSACGDTVVPIKAAGAAGGVIVGRSTAHIRIAKIGRAVVQASPAVSESMARTATCGIIFKVLKEWKRVEVVAGGTELFGEEHTGVPCIAKRGHPHHICRVISTAHNAIRGVVNDIGVNGDSGRVDLNQPTAGRTSLNPREVERMRSDVAKHQIARTRAGRLHKLNVVDSTWRGGTATGVIGPGKHQTIGASAGNEKFLIIVLPGGLQIQLVSTAEADEACGQRSRAPVVGTGAACGVLARRWVESGRGQENPNVVVVALAIALPIIGDHVASRTEREFLIGIHKRNRINSVGVCGAVVVGDVEALRTSVVCSGSNKPFVGLGTVSKHPSRRVVYALEVARVAKRLTLRYPWHDKHRDHE